MRNLALLTTVALLATGCGSESTSESAAVSSTYEPGQLWAYHNREGEDESRLAVLRLDSDPKLGTIVHVSIDGIAIPNAKAPGGVTEEISHLPMSKEALDRSVREQTGTRPLPDFQEGYKIWRKAHDSGQGGIFTATAAEAVDFVEQAINEAGSQN